MSIGLKETLDSCPKIPNTSPGRIKVRKHFGALIFGGVTLGAYIQKVFWVKRLLVDDKPLPYGFQSEKLITTLNA